MELDLHTNIHLHGLGINTLSTRRLLLQLVVFLPETPCSLMYGYWRLLRTQCLWLQLNLQECGSKFFPNVSRFVQEYTASYLPQQEPNILQTKINSQLLRSLLCARYVDPTRNLILGIFAFVLWQQFCDPSCHVSEKFAWVFEPHEIRFYSPELQYCYSIFYVLITRTVHKTTDVYPSSHRPQHHGYNRPPST